MTRYLIDTHTFLWAVTEPERLSNRIQNILHDTTMTVFLSAVSPWELAIKVNLGKLNAAAILMDFERIVQRGQYELLDIPAQHAIRAGFLPRHHGDPFDRLLAAQALALNVPLLSRDDVFDLYGVTRIWD